MRTYRVDLLVNEQIITGEHSEEWVSSAKIAYIFEPEKKDDLPELDIDPEELTEDELDEWLHGSKKLIHIHDSSDGGQTPDTGLGSEPIEEESILDLVPEEPGKEQDIWNNLDEHFTTTRALADADFVRVMSWEEI